MKKLLFPFLLVTCLLVISFTFKSDKSGSLTMNNIVVEFITTNGNGNNLFIDNFCIGSQNSNDLSLRSFNIPDKNYLLPGQTTAKVQPVAMVTNNGRNSASGATITLMVTGTTYNVTQSIPTLSMGYTTPITFDSLDFNVNTVKNIKVFINWSADENKANDSLFRSCVFHTGVNRKVLFEAFTSTTCAPCASQNPSLDAFIQARFDTVIAIKYHVWWPAAGDPMYMANVNQNSARVYTYSITSVPCLQIDGVHQQISGYTTLSNLLNPYNARLSKGAPLSLSVTDVRLPGDTIKSTVTLNIVSPLSADANYRLKISAIERKVTYPTPPGSNGETIFYDVFRRAYPSTYGSSIPLSPGTYTYEFKYKRESNWVDSMMYTAAFVQEESSREVMNCAKSRNYYADNDISKAPVAVSNENDACLNTQNTYYQPDAMFNYEGFEYSFPPEGWNMQNPDDGITYMKVSTPNGPSFAGSNAIRMRFFSYTDIGQIDYLITKPYNNIETNDSIRFDWAYAPRTGFTDRLQVKVSTNGGNTFPYTIFDKSGTLLGTAPAQATAFTPTSPSQWNTFKARLSDVLVSINNNEEIPLKYNLSQNYPNPFNPSTRINYSVVEKGIVTITIYDLLGRKVAGLVNDVKSPGNYEVIFDASKLASGMYIYKMETEKFSASRKMVLIR
jgi:hypothetical protein